MPVQVLFSSNRSSDIMRTTIISTSKVKTHKILTLSILNSLAVGFTTITIIQLIGHNGILGPVGTFAVWIIIIIKASQVIWKVKSVSFDDSSVYYEQKGFEVQVPFEEIRDIEIKSLTGIYSINLYNKNQDGEKIYFKTSMWYPLNFKKKDEEVNVLRDKIDQYKRTLPEKNFASLPSYKI